MNYEEFLEKATQLHEESKIHNFSVIILAEGFNEMNTHIETHCFGHRPEDMENSPLFYMLMKLIHKAKVHSDETEAEDKSQVEMDLTIP